MKNPIALVVLLLTFLTSMVGVGCRKEAGPPAPLVAEQIPAEFAQGFKDAKPEVKELADKVVKALEAKDYPAAHQAVQDLTMSPAASKAQQLLATRAFLTITTLLQTAAQTQGDEKAAEALKIYQSTK
jgi:hypothetical protein